MIERDPGPARPPAGTRRRSALRVRQPHPLRQAPNTSPFIEPSPSSADLLPERRRQRKQRRSARAAFLHYPPPSAASGPRPFPPIRGLSASSAWYPAAAPSPPRASDRRKTARRQQNRDDAAVYAHSSPSRKTSSPRPDLARVLRVLLGSSRAGERELSSLWVLSVTLSAFGTLRSRTHRRGVAAARALRRSTSAGTAEVALQVSRPQPSRRSTGPPGSEYTPASCKPDADPDEDVCERDLPVGDVLLPAHEHPEEREQKEDVAKQQVNRAPRAPTSFAERGATGS